MPFFLICIAGNLVNNLDYEYDLKKLKWNLVVFPTGWCGKIISHINRIDFEANKLQSIYLVGKTTNDAKQNTVNLFNR